MTPSFDATQHKQQLRAYFNGIGFERWSAIYGSARLSGGRRSIRDGHAIMLSQAEMWLAERGLPRGSTAYDAGCGTGLFSINLARKGYHVTAADLAPQMVRQAQHDATHAGVADSIRFVAGDLETVGGIHDIVVCFDVLIHYPRDGFAPLAQRLAHMTRDTLILTYAPHNNLLALKHWVGGHFPRSQRRTEIQMMPQPFVHQTLEAAGMRVQRSTRVSRGFYHVTLLEAHPA